LEGVVRLAARPLFFDIRERPPLESRVMKLACLSLALLLLPGCERNSDTPTPRESRQLDDAADLLNEAPDNLDAVDDSAFNSAAPVNAG
jgi:hypothetical protein